MILFYNREHNCSKDICNGSRRDIACTSANYWHCVCSYVRNDRFCSSDIDVASTARLTAYANYLLIYRRITTKRVDCEMQLAGLRAM